MDDRPQRRFPRRTLDIEASVGGVFHKHNVIAQADQFGGASFELIFLFRKWSFHVARPMLESIYHTIGAILDDGRQ